MGNPLTYHDGRTFSWVRGRDLASTSKSGVTTSFTYAPSGDRITKTSGGVTHNYFWQDGVLLRETYGDNELEFLYDGAGSPLGFLYNDTAYFYVKNLQGDVVRVINVSGSVVASYSYNAYGEILSSSGTMADINPIRYRGYYYDSETGFYYLGARYYDPEICRFINADEYTSTGQGFIGMNKFAYCGNNPICWIDSEGNVHILVAGAVSGVFGFVAKVFENAWRIQQGQDIPWYHGAGTAFVTSFLSGMLCAAPIPIGYTVAGNALLSAASDYQSQATDPYSDGINLGEVFLSALWGGAVAYTGYKPLNLETMNTRLLQGLRSGSAATAWKAAQYYFSQTNTLFRQNFYGLPVLVNNVLIYIGEGLSKSLLNVLIQQCYQHSEGSQRPAAYYTITSNGTWRAHYA